MSSYKRHYERPDLWSNIKANNIFPLIMLLVATLSAVYLFQSKADRALDGVTDVKVMMNEYRTLEYKNAIDISSIKSRMGMPDEGEIMSASTSAPLSIPSKGGAK